VHLTTVVFVGLKLLTELPLQLVEAAFHHIIEVAKDHFGPSFLVLANCVEPNLTNIATEAFDKLHQNGMAGITRSQFERNQYALTEDLEFAVDSCASTVKETPQMAVIRGHTGLRFIERPARWLWDEYMTLSPHQHEQVLDSRVGLLLAWFR